MKPYGLLLILAITVLGSCAPRTVFGPARLIYQKDRPIEIELDSYLFRPNHIAIIGDQSPLTFHLTNTASIRHNFTLIDSPKRVLITKDLEPGKSITFTIESLPPGNYVFCCNRFLHRQGGMKGMIMVN